MSRHRASTPTRGRWPKEARLRTPTEIRAVVNTGAVFPGAEVIVRRAPSPTGRARLGMSAPHRYGGAVRRNRFRRLVREAFRQIQEELGAHDVFVSPKRTLETPTLEGIRRDLLRTRHARPATGRPRGTRSRRT